MEDENRYLNLLSIFHYVVAGIAGLFSCLPIAQLSIGISAMSQMPLFLSPNMVSEDMFSPGVLMPLWFTSVIALIITFGWMFSIATALSGYFIRKRRWHTYCLVMGGIETIFTPFGTVLGVFTIILLMRPSVKALFQRERDNE